MKVAALVKSSATVEMMAMQLAVLLGLGQSATALKISTTAAATFSPASVMLSTQASGARRGTNLKVRASLGGVVA